MALEKMGSSSAWDNFKRERLAPLAAGAPSNHGHSHSHEPMGMADLSNGNGAGDSLSSAGNHGHGHGAAHRPLKNHQINALLREKPKLQKALREWRMDSGLLSEALRHIGLKKTEGAIQETIETMEWKKIHRPGAYCRRCIMTAYEEQYGKPWPHDKEAQE